MYQVWNVRSGEGRQPGDAVAVHGHPGRRHDDHTSAGQPGPHAEVESLVGADEGGVEALQLAPGVGPHQDAAHVRPEHVLGRVVLPWSYSPSASPTVRPNFVIVVPSDTM
ncbi:hypothetical protein L2X98_21115 [Microbacterium elymi]|uniref:Uncharacterized protein n=1 Tax=Microbacterium elymi TaxID=2909587 RepID=A0ABY5NKY0_9MICO|nr:hypothetical protein [Microbacterium elymi]UUT35726.1 hypothetical protein L2X98_21115 [Microbacterium elymi]